MNVFFRIIGFVSALVWTLTGSARSVGEHYTKEEYRIAMRDGIRLYTAVYSPREADHAPILIFRTPYGCWPYGPEAFPEGFEKDYYRAYLDRGYILVLQDVRGRYMSEGEFVNVRPVAGAVADELTDSYDTVDWLVRNIPGNNGCVGFAGCSYPGFYALMGGLCGHPAVKAVSPQAPVTDWFMGDDVHHNGVLMLTDSYAFIPSMSRAEPHQPAVRMPAKKAPPRGPDEYAFFLGCGTLDSLTRLLEPTPFWNEMAAHPDYNAWWQARDTRRACRDVGPAVLVVGGTFDAEDCFGAWRLYEALRRQSPRTECYLAVGPWAHGAWLGEGRRLGVFDFGEEASGRYYMEHFELPFFERYLRGAATGLPAVSVFSSGDDRWHSFDCWPPRRADSVTLYLGAGGRLDTLASSLCSSSCYVSDPAHPVPYHTPSGPRRVKEYMVADQRFTDGRSDVLVFQTEPLAGDWTLAGPVEVKLRVAISTTDADFAVRLSDVFPDDERGGYRMLVRGDVMRGRYRRSFSDPEPFIPGAADEVSFVMSDIAHTFRAGHRLMVQVQSSWFPLAERSPQQFVDLWHCRASDFVPCRVEVFLGGDAPSSVTVRRLGAE